VRFVEFYDEDEKIFVIGKAKGVEGGVRFGEGALPLHRRFVYFSLQNAEF